MIGKSFNCCIIGVLGSLGYYLGAFMCTSCWKGTSPSGPVNLCHLDLSHLWQQREDQTPTAQAVVWLTLWFGFSAACSSEREQPPALPPGRRGQVRAWTCVATQALKLGTCSTHNVAHVLCHPLSMLPILLIPPQQRCAPPNVPV
jgi:hypothetical protein